MAQERDKMDYLAMYFQCPFHFLPCLHYYFHFVGHLYAVIFYEMANEMKERQYFQVATIISKGQEKMFALAGRSSSSSINAVEEWVEESSTWKAADNLVEKRNSFALVSAPGNLLC